MTSIPSGFSQMERSRSAQLEVVYLGGDFLSLSLEALLSCPYVNLRAVFASAQPHHFRVRQLAHQAKAKLVVDPLDLARHGSLFEGVDLLLTAGFSQKVPDVGARYSLNLHPSLLPACRGANPMPWILFDYPRAAGVTLHVHADTYDTGPIVASRPIAGAETLTFEAYCMLCNQFGSDLTTSFLADPERLYAEVRPQPDQDTPLIQSFPAHRRFISGAMTGQEIVNRVRRLGPQGAVLVVDGVKIRVTGAEWVPARATEFNKPFENNGFYSALKCRDGFVLFKQGTLHKI